MNYEDQRLDELQFVLSGLASKTNRVIGLFPLPEHSIASTHYQFV